MELNGRVTGWINENDKELVNVGQIKFSEGLDRANLGFADVNGITVPHPKPRCVLMYGAPC